jgi:hypothetical protein
MAAEAASSGFLESGFSHSPGARENLSRENDG